MTYIVQLSRLYDSPYNPDHRSCVNFTTATSMPVHQLVLTHLSGVIVNDHPCHCYCFLIAVTAFRNTIDEDISTFAIRQLKTNHLACLQADVAMKQLVYKVTKCYTQVTVSCW